MEKIFEKNSDITNRQSWVSPSIKVNVTTSVESDLWKIAKENKIFWNEALAFGIKFLLAEKQGIEGVHPENSLSAKIERLNKNFSAKSQECEALRDQLKVQLSNVEEEEIDKILKEGTLNDE